MNDHARKMALRDSSSSRLQLAFVFWDEDVMEQMLERIKDYPLVDVSRELFLSCCLFTLIDINLHSHFFSYRDKLHGSIPGSLLQDWPHLL